MTVKVGLALAYWVWTALLALTAGFVGAALNCEGGDECESDSPSWLQPWTWGDHYVFPETAYAALGGVAAASAFVVLIWRRRPIAAAGVLAASLAFMSYPFFGGLTSAGRIVFALGPLLAFATLLYSAAAAAGRESYRDPRRTRAR